MSSSSSVSSIVDRSTRTAECRLVVEWDRIDWLLVPFRFDPSNACEFNAELSQEPEFSFIPAADRDAFFAFTPEQVVCLDGAVVRLVNPATNSCRWRIIYRGTPFVDETVAVVSRVRPAVAAAASDLVPCVQCGRGRTIAPRVGCAASTACRVHLCASRTCMERHRVVCRATPAWRCDSCHRGFRDDVRGRCVVPGCTIRVCSRGKCRVTHRLTCRGLIARAARRNTEQEVKGRLASARWAIPTMPASLASPSPHQPPPPQSIDRTPAVRDGVIAQARMADCSVCMDAKVDAILTGCSHVNMCMACAARVTQCPTCRAPFAAAGVRSMAQLHVNTV